MSSKIPILGEKPLIGVVHLPPLPCWGRFVDLDRIIEYAINEAKKLEKAGFDAVILENYGDKPYNVDYIDDFQLAAFTVIASSIVKELNIPVGVNILRNAVKQAIAVAFSSRASFIRVNNLCELRYSVEGLLEPVPNATRILDILPRKILLLADVSVKHSYSLGEYRLENILLDCIDRLRPDVIVVTGEKTGEAPKPGYVASVKKLAKIPVVVGSGINYDNIGAFIDVADGFIVGTYLKINNITDNPIDPRKAQELVKKLRNLKRE